MRLAEIIFWGSLALGLYGYVLYPLCIWLASRGRRQRAAGLQVVAEGDVADDPDDDSCLRPAVTLLILANRDEHRIVERLTNAMELDYPEWRLQILVASIGEDDLTSLLARSFDKRRIDVLQFPRGGEAAALNACVRQATGKILVFSDVRTMMHPDAVLRLARHFCDPDVGGVCGKLEVVDPTNGRVLHRPLSRFENYLKECEIRLGALPEVNRGIYAIRKDLFVPLIDQATVNDFLIAMRVRRQGARLLYDDSAVATRDVVAAADESQRGRGTRTEVARRLKQLWPVVNCGRGGLSFLFCLNRAFRCFCPAFLIVAFVSNACLTDDPFYLHFLLLHELFYVAALICLFVIAEKTWQRTTSGRPTGFLRSLLGRSRKPLAAETRAVPTRSAL